MRPTIEQFRKPITALYREANQLSRLDVDLAYLFSAYLKTESWWYDNFDKVQDVRLAILGEAPLFGDEESYIYNPRSKLTSFLLPGSLVPTARDRQPRTKTDMLTALRELGIVVIDLFPYALNPRHTPFGYRDLNQKKKLKLAIESGTFHLRPKILACRERGAATVFCARYAAIRDIAELVLPRMNEEPESDRMGIPVISMQGGMIDKQKLRQVYEGLASR